MSDLTPLHWLPRRHLGRSTPPHHPSQAQGRWGSPPNRSSRRRSFLLFNGLVTGLLMTGLTGCSIVEEYLAAVDDDAASEDVAVASPTPAETPVVPVAEPEPAEPAATQRPDTYPDALKKANLAQTLSQSAQSTDDWTLVAGRWDQAINLLESVPDSSENYSNVAGKLSEYRRQRDSAKVKANQPIPTTSPLGRVVVVSDEEEENAAPAVATDEGGETEETITETASGDDDASPNLSVQPPESLADAGNASGGLYSAPIVRRSGGTPVIQVRFNNRYTVEMIVDTGASGTVLTQAVARNLGVEVIGETNMSTASAQSVPFQLGRVSTIDVQGAVLQNPVVAIAGPGLETGLLGNDFFKDYDVTVKSDVVEFRER